MLDNFKNRLSHAWNAFMNKDPTSYNYDYMGYGTGYRPDRLRLTVTNERSIIASIYNRVGIDAASMKILHCRLDSEGKYLETINSRLNQCLNVSANLDQTGRSFIQDAVMSLCDEGSIAIVPVDTDINPLTKSYEIFSLRVGKIIEWFPEHVRVRLYDEKDGRKKDVTLSKKVVAIVENPLYSVMNETNSTLKRLISKLNILDSIDNQSGSGKLDLIIQLPYVIKTEQRRQEAERRRDDIERQLAGSKYGVAYTDGTEKVIQLNRAVENNLMNQITYLITMLYGQLGLTESVFNGTADEKEMLNYYTRTIEPILSAITLEIKRKFLTPTARTQNQSIEIFRDPFRNIPVTELANAADKYTRNEILTSNEIRSILGYKPSKDPKADELRNKNIAAPRENQNGSSLSENENNEEEEYE